LGVGKRARFRHEICRLAARPILGIPQICREMLLGSAIHKDMNHAELLETERWQRLRRFVYLRDGGRCVICGAPGLDTHHLSYLLGFFNPAAVALVCRPCHLAWQGCDPNHLPEDNCFKPEMMKIAELSRNLGKGTLFQAPVIDLLGD